jgi:16S rRNA (guanine527-N7)-methyltransferase
VSGADAPKPRRAARATPQAREWSADVERRVARYAEELARWGSRINLVGSTEPAALRRHLDDALAAAEALPRGARVVDLGSGAGLPGVPVAIARPDLQVSLVEIRERRVNFLRHVARALPVECEILRVRIEDPPPDLECDVALLRGVANVQESLKLGRFWAGPGAEIWIWTRETLDSLCAELRSGASEIPLGERGRILRVPAANVPRGTPR